MEDADRPPETVNQEQESTPNKTVPDWQSYDLPEDEDLSALLLGASAQRHVPKRLALKGWLAIVLLIGACIAQHYVHGPLFLNPGSEQVVVLYRTEIAHAFGMSPIRFSRKPTFRAPFFEVARVNRHSDLATTVLVEGSNAQGLEFPTQSISVIWSLDPNRLWDESRRGLMAAGGTDALVRQVTTLHARRAMASSSLVTDSIQTDLNGVDFEQSLRRALYDLGIRLESVTGMRFTITPELQTAYSALKAQEATVRELIKTQKSLVTKRADALSKIKSDSENTMANMLAAHGDAMSSLQDKLDRKGQATESTITESRLSAETDRAIYQMQAQHLHEIYQLKTVSYRQFFENNARIHPALEKVVPTSLRAPSHPAAAHQQRGSDDQ